MNGPAPINDRRLRFDSFSENDLFAKKPRLPAMGWNSWNAFGSGQRCGGSARHHQAGD